MKPKSIMGALRLMVLFLAIAAWVAFSDVIFPPREVSSPPPITEGATPLDHTLTVSQNYGDFIFEENMPLSTRICFPEGCRTIGEIRVWIGATP